MADAQQSPAEQMAAYWRDWFAQMNAAGGAQQAQQQQQAAAAAMGQFAGAPPFPWTPSPETMRQMQAAFLDALAQQCDQHMRSPQFLESMKRSMDQALEFRQRVEHFVKDNAAAAFSGVSGGAPEEIIGAIRLIETRLNERLDDLARRLDRLESAAGRAPDAPPKKKPGARKSAAPPGATPKKKPAAKKSARRAR